MIRVKSSRNVLNSSRTAALKIAAAYVGVGALWIVFSDRFLADSIVNEPAHQVTIWQTIKGWFFVGATGCGLYFLSRHFLLAEHRNRDAMHDIQERLRLKQLQAQREQAIIGQLGHVLAAADTLEKLGEAVLRTVTNLWPWDAFFFSVRQSGQGKVRSILQVDTIDGVKQYFPPHRYNTFLPDSVKAGQPLLTLRDPKIMFESPHRFGDKSKPSLSIMYAPIMTAAKRLGLLSVQSYSQNAYDQEALALLQRIADAASPALERCRAEERSRAFSSLGEQLSAVTTPEEVANIIVAVADNLIGWDACSMMLYSAHENRVHRLIAYDVIDGKRAMLPTRTDPMEPKLLVLRALKEGQVLILRDPEEQGEGESVRFGNESRPSASIIWVAMRSPTGITGVLTIQSYTAQAYDEEDMSVLQALANHCSGALERTRAEQKLRVNEERYRHAITTAGAVPYQFDYKANLYTFVGEGIERITGWPAIEFTAERWQEMIEEVVAHGGEGTDDFENVARQVREGRVSSWKADIRIRTRSGESRWIADTSIEMPDEQGESAGSLGILQDITQRKKTEHELLHTSLHDPLTGLANRALLLDHVQQALHRSHRWDEYGFAVAFIDLDRFKNVNDSLGHIVGDQMLATIAQRLQSCIRPGDTAARFAGDEFVLILEDVRNPDDVAPIAARLLHDISIPMNFDGNEVFPSASIGIAFSSPSHAEPEELMRDADTALYRAKAKGKARYEVFDPSVRVHTITTLELENELRRAHERNELLIHYQPILDLKSGGIVRFEALLRWQHSVRGLIALSDFIPMAEETGLIIPIGYWVMEEAVSQLRQWQDAFPSHPPLSMAVNLSVRQLGVHNLDQRILEIIRKSNIGPQSFKFEITETTLMEKRESITELLTRFKDQGFGLSIDDFGTGYSSLSYLHQFPIDRLKIDRSFIRHIESGGREREIVRAIILLAKSLGLGTTAEGVETPAQLAILREMKCQCAQGFLFSKPLPAAEATALLAAKPHW